ncbi:hypothetical protein H8R02_28430 [Ramlibacter sp. GTP1]|uniref:Uncharacterized protein n=1 Tax=Ramlibacter albus TaxID=2079448 RepID=A0A923ME25_9BURK|nr:hypothetical protein [Ramlibacter albus]MBC5768421.1 hypothetical protein [Ramlibacter albus]
MSSGDVSFVVPPKATWPTSGAKSSNTDTVSVTGFGSFGPPDTSVSIVTVRLSPCPSVPASSTTRAQYVTLPVRWTPVSSKLHVPAAVSCFTSTQWVPSVLSWMRWLAPSGVLVPLTMSVVSLVLKSALLMPRSSVIAVILTSSSAPGPSNRTVIACRASSVPALPARSTTRARYSKSPVWPTRSVNVHVVADIAASLQVAPWSLDTCTRLSARAVCVPLTVRLVSLVMKSPAVPVSSEMAVMATFSPAPGATVSIVTTFESFAPSLPAASMTRTRYVTLPLRATVSS